LYYANEEEVRHQRGAVWLQAALTSGYRHLDCAEYYVIFH
jgi:diketogulonate reductase-like aldo/keto reductase